MRIRAQHALLTLVAACLLPGLQAMAQPVAIEGRHYTIPGVLELPATAGASAPAVLLLHGQASQKNEVGDLYRALAQALREAGIASLRIDFAGTGDSPVSYREYRLGSATEDALAALAFLRTQPGIAGHAIAVLGFSEGGLIAQNVALADPRIAALATWSSVATDGPGDFRRDFDAHHQIARRDGFVAFDFAWLAEPLEFDLRWFEEMRTHTTFSRMRAYEKPILAIAGAADEIVPYTQSMALVAQSPHPQSRAVLLAGADHIFNVLDEASGTRAPTSSQQLLAETVRWLGGVLQGDAQR